MTSALFTSVHIGGRQTPHRVVMAPMTRARSTQPGDVPNTVNARYYAQRASAALIVQAVSLIMTIPRNRPVSKSIQALVGLSHRFGQAMSARGRGGIINIASNSAFQPLPYMATYAASKAFVLHFGEALQHELSPKGVRVMTACPGPTATSFFEGTPTTMSDRSFDTPEMVVRGILRAFDQGKAVA